MLGLVLPVAFALGIALIRGGSFAGLAQQRILWWPLVLLALAIQVPAYSLPIGNWLPVEDVARACTVATTALVLLMLLRNATGRTRAACLIAATGVALNLVVMVANGGLMPRVDEFAPRTLSRAAAANTPSNTAASGPETRLRWLGDTLAQPDWLPFANLVSLGDVLLSLGAAYLVYQVTRRRPTPVSVGAVV